MSIIDANSHVVFINTKTNELKCVKVPRKQPVFLKPFSFHVDSLIGQQYGQKYQVTKQKLVKVDNPSVAINDPVTNCTKTNEFIKDDGSTQVLSQHDIEEMKAKGVKGEEIVKTLLENSSSYQEKTEFSKAKWLKKKINKYQPNIVTRKPSIRLFGTSNTSKIRADILAKLINNANVWNGSKVIVVECRDDLLSSAFTQRVHSNGSVIQVFEQKLPHIMFSRWLDFKKSQLEVLKYFPLKFLFKLSGVSTTANEPSEADQQEKLTDVDCEAELGKRKREEETEIEFQKYANVYENMKNNDFDSLVISANYDPYPVIELLWQCLRCSGTLVLHTEYLSAVIESANFVNIQGCCELTIVDQWFREIQVLPGRTHPDMRMQTGGGFILTCTKLDKEVYEHGTVVPALIELSEGNHTSATTKID